MTTGHPISLEKPFALDSDHFVGYHDVCPWCPDNRWLLAHRATVGGGLPGPDDEVEILLLEHSLGGTLTVGDTRIAGRTRAWNWQLGARAQWLPIEDESLLIYNGRADGGFSSTIFDPNRELHRTLPFPVYSVGPDGRLAAYVDFGRLHQLRAGYGYPPRSERDADADEDGLWLGDLEAGNSGLLLSHREIAREIDVPDFASVARPPWIEHPTFSPSGERLAFLFRAMASDGGLPTRLVITDLECSTVHSPELAELTHYAWLDEDRILAWGRDPGSPAGRLQRLGLPDALMRVARAVSRRFPTGPVRQQIVGDRFRVVDLAAGMVEDFPCALRRDGHPAPRPGSEIVLFDTYPDADGCQRLYLVDPGSEQRIELGRWPTHKVGGVDRCDLHPRWDRAGRRICVDSAHGGRRGVYIADLTAAIKTLEEKR